MQPRKKMSLQDLKDLFSGASGIMPIGSVKSGMTRKGAVHKRNPTWMPPKSALTPAQWHRAQRAANAKKGKV